MAFRLTKQIVFITVLVWCFGAALSQSLVTGSTGKNSQLNAEVPLQQMALEDLIGAHEITFRWITLNGVSNSVMIDLPGIEAEFGATGEGFLFADLEVLRVGVLNKGGKQSQALVGLALGPYELSLILDFDPGLGAITGSTARTFVSPTPYQIEVKNWRTGATKSFSGVAGGDDNSYGQLMSGTGSDSYQNGTSEWVNLKNLRVRETPNSQCSFREISGGIISIVRDKSRPWCCVAESPEFQMIPKANDFKVAFDFNPIKADWGHYPGIYFGEAPLYDAETMKKNCAFHFVIWWSDGIVKKLSLSNSQGNYIRSSTVPSLNEWFKVELIYNGNSQRMRAKIFRADGTLFLNKESYFPLNNDFNRVFIGEIQGGSRYGKLAEIGVRNLKVNRQ